MTRIGIDVGGTNTDAVVLENTNVLAATKVATTQDVMGGILSALQAVLVDPAVDAGETEAVMIGTTHFINAVVQWRDLSRVASMRIGLPASASLPPFTDWPVDLAELVNGGVYMVEGGHEFDGRPPMPVDEVAIRTAARQMRNSNVVTTCWTTMLMPATRSR